jgi:hypothetical protein
MDFAYIVSLGTYPTIQQESVSTDLALFASRSVAQKSF